MAAIYLVRHGSHAVMDQVLAGRSDAVGLSEKGFAQIHSLAGEVNRLAPDLVQSSPRRRCRETAMILATSAVVPLQIAPALDEIDFGGWTGKSFAELDGDERWRRWNSERVGVSPPGGETASAAQARILRHIEEVAASPLAAVVMVTHAELIRAVLLSRNGLGLEAWHGIHIPPAGMVRVDVPMPENLAQAAASCGS